MKLAMYGVGLHPSGVHPSGEGSFRGVLSGGGPSIGGRDYPELYGFRGTSVTESVLDRQFFQSPWGLATEVSTFKSV
jgi:hypothetical protein